MASLQSGVGGGVKKKERPLIRALALLSPVCWSIWGMFRAAGGDITPEKHVCKEVRTSLHTSPE